MPLALPDPRVKIAKSPHSLPSVPAFFGRTLSSNCVPSGNPAQTTGLAPDILSIVSSFIKNSEGKESIMNFEPKKVPSRIVSHAKKRDASLAHKLRETKYRDKAHDQLRGFFFRKQEAHLKSQLGVTSITNNADFVRVSDLHSLQTPPNYQPSDQCKSGADLALALGLNEDDDDKMFIVDPTRGRVHEAHKRLAVKQTPAVLREFQQRVEMGFLVTSPTGLRQLLAVTTQREGARIICSATP